MDWPTIIEIDSGIPFPFRALSEIIIYSIALHYSRQYFRLSHGLDTPSLRYTTGTPNDYFISFINSFN